MYCDGCGQNSDWIGTGSDWREVSGAGATRPLLECERCGHRKHAR